MPRQVSSQAQGLSAGLDEVGLGAMAGPMTVAVAVFPTNMRPIPGVTDSKKLTPARRFELARIIMKEAVFFGTGWASPEVIDALGVAEAWRRACMDALEGAPKLDLLMIDGDRPLDYYHEPQEVIVKGDATVWQIGAASIVAKVVRDLEMTGMSRHYQGYDWASNMGYGSSAHVKALLEKGPTPLHRALYLRNLFGSHKDKLAGTNWESWMSSRLS